MTTVVAACPECGSTNVVFVSETTVCVRTHRFMCGACGHETPAREELRAADGDVRWIELASRKMVREVVL